jgi:hypothetical protein
MYKGIPMMGRDPDGKAKIINVDENGNVKVQQSGTTVSIKALKDRQNEAIDNILTVLANKDIVTFLPMWEDEGETEVRDLLNSNIIFEPHGDVTLGTEGIFGQCPSFNGGGLRQKPITENDTGEVVDPLDSPTKKLATQMHPISGNISHVLLHLRRYGDLPNAKLKVSVYSNDGGQPGSILYDFQIAPSLNTTWVSIACNDLSTSWTQRGFPFVTPVYCRNQTIWLVVEYEDGTGVDESNYIAWRYRGAEDTYGTARAVWDGSEWTVTSNTAHRFLAYTNELSLEDSDFTILCAAREFPGQTETENYILSTSGRDTSAIHGLYYQRDFNEISAVVFQDGGSRLTVKGKTNINEWAVYAVTYDRANGYERQKLYCNGQLIAVNGSDLSGLGAIPVSFPWQIGGLIGYTGAFTRQFRGQIGPILAVRSVLSHGEIVRISRYLTLHSGGE